MSNPHKIHNYAYGNTIIFISHYFIYIYIYLLFTIFQYV
jgi:hypothetical protein